MCCTPTTTTFVGAITEAISAVLGWIGTVLDAFLTGELSVLLPLFAVGIVISVVMLTVRVIRSFTWGS